MRGERSATNWSILSSAPAMSMATSGTPNISTRSPVIFRGSAAMRVIMKKITKPSTRAAARIASFARKVTRTTSTRARATVQR